MYVCKSFYQQFEWAEEQHWRAVSCLPVLICQGDEDVVTTMDGAQNLIKLLTHLQSKGTEKGTEKEAVKEVVSVTRTAESTQPTSTTSTADISIENKDLKSTTNSESPFRLVVINKAGHSLIEEQPTQIATFMEEFISGTCNLKIPPVIVEVSAVAAN